MLTLKVVKSIKQKGLRIDADLFLQPSLIIFTKGMNKFEPNCIYHIWDIWDSMKVSE